MVRSMGALIAGLLVMLIVISSIQWIGHSIYPPPAGLDPQDSAKAAAAVALLPIGALAMVLLSYAAGSFLGAGTGATVSARHKRGVAILLGLVMTALVAMNFVIIPHPLWMMIVGLLIPIPFALLGWRVFR